MKFEEEIYKLSARIAFLEDQSGISPLDHELPVKEPKPDLGPVVELPTVIAIVTRNPSAPIVDSEANSNEADTSDTDEKAAE